MRKLNSCDSIQSNIIDGLSDESYITNLRRLHFCNILNANSIDVYLKSEIMGKLENVQDTEDIFFEKNIYFHKTKLQKNHTYNTKHTIYNRKEIKAKKRLEIFKEGRKKKWRVAIMSFIQSIDIIRSRCSAYILFR